jgi:deoxyribonuclease-1-like protein
MRKFPALLLLVVALGGAAFYVHQHYEIEGFERLALRHREASAADRSYDVESPGRAAHDTIRIGSFNIQVFGTTKAHKPRVMEILAEVVRDFDLVAIQEIRSKDDTLLPRFVEQVNASGARYDYAIGPRLGHSDSKEQYAFIFNTETIEIDRAGTFTVADPNQRLQRPPLVGMFRCRGPPPDKAFTFFLADVHTQPSRVHEELTALRDAYRALLNNDRKEDDVILLGDLNASEKQLGDLGQISGITWVLSDTPTNTRGTKSYDNMLFLARETNEYTGRSGVIDLVRRFNLTTEQALEVSDHFPIWAEFSIYEGGNRGRVASLPEPSMN